MPPQKSNKTVETYNRDYRLLEVIGELHRMGYERLRISAGVGPTGAWRCIAGSAQKFSSEHGGQLLERRNAYGYSREPWLDDQAASLREIAEKFIDECPLVAIASLGKDPEYVEWFSKMLRDAAPVSVPFMHRDEEYFDRVILRNKNIEIENPPLVTTFQNGADEIPEITRHRFQGCLAGLAAGDAVGTTAEFLWRGKFPEVTDMVGGGIFGLKPGQWTDDTSMALCLGESLVTCKGVDYADQMDRYIRWCREGYLSSTGECFDIGRTVFVALERYLSNGNPLSGSSDPGTAGNGCIMRLAPVPMLFYKDIGLAEQISGDSSKTTHGAQECIDASKLFGRLLAMALQGKGIPRQIDDTPYLSSPRVAAIARGDYLAKTIDEIKGSGYVVESLEAALWCFHNTYNYRGAVLKATNLGYDADTTAAICGQLAGAVYGVGAIPRGWMDKLCMKDFIIDLADRLFELAIERS